MIFLARNFLIVLAVLLSPVWLVFAVGGMIADKRGQRACAVLKGEEKSHG